MRSSKFAVFGSFGIRNLGNECTLEAMLQNLREYAPSGSKFYTISYDPFDTLNRHGLSAIPICPRNQHAGSRPPRALKQNKLARLMRGLLMAPVELRNWRAAVELLRGTDVVLMTGTGMLTDYSTNAFGTPYDIFKWSMAAKLAGCKLLFVSVGVGPIYESLSRFFIKRALSLADYRSYRDEFSKLRLQRYGFDSSHDLVIPDLAFSLSNVLWRPRRAKTARKVVGVGVISHFDPRAMGEHNRPAIYGSYLRKTSELILWLVKNGYGVRILHGDLDCDTQVRRDVRAEVERQGCKYDVAGIIDEDMETVDDLIAQLASTDLLISCRYHNILLALMLGKPVISISYDPKNNALLEAVGLGKYSQRFENWHVGTVVEQFLELEREFENLRDNVYARIREYQRIVRHQYESLVEFGIVKPSVVQAVQLGHQDHSDGFAASPAASEHYAGSGSRIPQDS